jgi:hypothetical protein
VPAPGLERRQASGEHQRSNVVGRSEDQAGFGATVAVAVAHRVGTWTEHECADQENPINNASFVATQA